MVLSLTWKTSFTMVTFSNGSSKEIVFCLHDIDENFRLIRLFHYSVNIVTSALHKSQVSWNIWPLSTKRGPMEKNSKIILNVASALLPVWRKYWFQKNDGNLYNILNHFFRDHILKVHNLRKHTDISDMKYRCSICPYATIENAALKKHIRFKHTHDVRNPSFQIEIFLLEMCTCIV